MTSELPTDLQVTNDFNDGSQSILESSNKQTGNKNSIHPNISLDRVTTSTDNIFIHSEPALYNTRENEYYNEPRRLCFSHPNINLKRENENMKQRQHILSHPNIKIEQVFAMNQNENSSQSRNLKSKINFETAIYSRNCDSLKQQTCRQSTEDAETDCGTEDGSLYPSSSSSNFCSNSLKPKTKKSNLKNRSISSMKGRKSKQFNIISPCRSFNVCNRCAQEKSRLACSSTDVCDICASESKQSRHVMRESRMKKQNIYEPSFDVCDSCIRARLSSFISKCNSLNVCDNCRTTKSLSNIDETSYTSKDVNNGYRGISSAQSRVDSTSCQSSKVCLVCAESQSIKKTPKSSCTSFDICNGCLKTIPSQTACESANVCDFCNQGNSSCKVVDVMNEEDNISSSDIRNQEVQLYNQSLCQSINICDPCRVTSRSEKSRSELDLAKSFVSFDSTKSAQKKDDFDYNSDCRSRKECANCGSLKASSILLNVTQYEKPRTKQSKSNCQRKEQKADKQKIKKVKIASLKKKLSKSKPKKLIELIDEKPKAVKTKAKVVTDEIRIKKTKLTDKDCQEVSKKYLKMKYEIEHKNYLIDKMNRELQTKMMKRRPEDELCKLKREIVKEVNLLSEMVRFAICTQRKNQAEKWGPIPISTTSATDVQQMKKSRWCPHKPIIKLKPPKTPSGISTVSGFEDLEDLLLQDEKELFVNAFKLESKEMKIQMFCKEIDQMECQLRKLQNEHKQMQAVNKCSVSCKENLPRGIKCKDLFSAW